MINSVIYSIAIYFSDMQFISCLPFTSPNLLSIVCLISQIFFPTPKQACNDIEKGANYLLVLMEVTEAVWVFVMVILVAKVELWLLKVLGIKDFVQITYLFLKFNRVQSILVRVVNVNYKLGKLIVLLSWWIWGNLHYFYMHLLLRSACQIVVFSQLSKAFWHMSSAIFIFLKI